MATVAAKIVQKHVVTTDFKFPDDSSILNIVNSTHTPDGMIKAIKPLLSVVVKILKETGITTLEDYITDKAEIVKTIEALRSTIHTVCCKLACECSRDDLDGGAMRIFESLGCYNWDAKVMIALTAFAMNYGELYLLSTAKTFLSETLVAFKQLPRITEHIQFLIEAVTKLSKCIIDVTCLFDYISHDNVYLVQCQSVFPIAAYCIIRSLVACSNHFTSLTNDESDAKYISFLVGRINNLYSHINDLKQNIEKAKYQESYLQITILFEIEQHTNLQILVGIHNSQDLKPLVHRQKGRVTLEEVLTNKIVMLYVSDLSIITKTEELSMLKARYTDMCSVNQQREIVWLPIIDNLTEAMKQTFSNLVTDMPWYVLDPVYLKQEAKKYIKDKWMYEKKTSLVVLDQGKVVCHDAFHMVRVCKKPYMTHEEVIRFWSNFSWKLNLFEDHFDATTKEWVKKDNNCICLYGGKGIDWIKTFIRESKRVSELCKTQLKMVYIGKHVKEVMRKAKDEKYNVDCWDEAKICSFWEHLDSMWHCKMQYQGKTSVTGNNDLIMQELMRMISFGNSEEGWAIFIKGTSSNIINADGKKLLECFQAWRTSKEEFFVQLSNMLGQGIPSPDHHCISFVLPRDAANFKEEVLCVHCQNPMEKFVLYRCCK